MYLRYREHLCKGKPARYLTQPINELSYPYNNFHKQTSFKASWGVESIYSLTLCNTWSEVRVNPESYRIHTLRKNNEWAWKLVCCIEKRKGKKACFFLILVLFYVLTAWSWHHELESVSLMHEYTNWESVKVFLMKTLLNLLFCSQRDDSHFAPLKYWK